ncbi:hypothetical protein SAMN06265371_106181 [Lutibacter agarilyticus]|uniref:Uncharacterized protein n=1 Tax=Lutibacter agarilyticus TaxID=1109740 RepID=A0A238XMI3_9FLAO|nr:hypothetical protein SAMN06265371_106181 [Lutibacter agarilyticus]
MTGKDFLKREHWSLLILYVIGLIAFLIHLFYFSKGDNENKIFPILAYSSMTIFFLRLAFAQMSKKVK